MAKNPKKKLTSMHRKEIIEEQPINQRPTQPYRVLVQCGICGKEVNEYLATWSEEDQEWLCRRHAPLAS